MARIAGVNIPTMKKIGTALTYIYGIGRNRSLQICQKAGVDCNKRASQLSDQEIRKLGETISASYAVEGDLRMEVSMNIKNLIDMKSYRGIRHVRKLPVRGQRTHTNAKTKKGKSIAIAGKKKVAK